MLLLAVVEAFDADVGVLVVRVEEKFEENEFDDDEGVEEGKDETTFIL